ncbi:MAG: hypothetical protein JWL79_1771 [Frankiales bacterium]|nr:hypothetical protein [Frankiales bacterium]
MILAHPAHVVATASVGTVALRVLLLVGAAVLAGTAVSSRRLWTLPLLSAPVLLAVSGTSGWFRVSVVVHVAAASLWLGCVLRVVAVRQRDRARVVARVAPLAVTSAVAVAGSGVAQALADRVRIDGITFDRLVLVKAGLLVLATALGARAATRVAPRSLELVALVAAAGLGAALIAVPSAPPAGQPVLTAYGTLVPQRPGTNYLHADGQWQRIQLPPGRSTLRLSQGTLLVDTGSRRGLQPDGPECATALLVKPALTRCPDQALDPQDAAALTVLTGWLHRRGIGAVAVQADGTARSEAAARLLGGSAARPEALVVTGGWASAAATLKRLGRTAPAGGVYLAPWLLVGPLLTAYATTAPLVVLPFDPTSRDALRYAASLPAGETPTAAGYRAWGGATGVPQVWATSPASIFPSDLGHDHWSASGWFPGGVLVAVASGRASG